MRKILDKEKLRKAIYGIATSLEVALSVLLAVVILVLICELAVQLFDISYLWKDPDAFSFFLESVMELAIGVECIKMLCIHTPETVVEVLLFAIARQIVVSHSSVLDTVIGVVCIAILFATRKFLFMAADDKKTNN